MNWRAFYSTFSLSLSPGGKLFVLSVVDCVTGQKADAAALPLLLPLSASDFCLID